MAVNGSGIHDTARVLKISPTTVIEELKKNIDSYSLRTKHDWHNARSQPVEVLLFRVLDPEAELDEMWSFGQSKQQQRWLWQAVDHTTGEVLAYVLNTREDRAFLELKALLTTLWNPALYRWLGDV